MSRRKRLLGAAMGLVLAAGFAAGIRSAAATENTNPALQALISRLPDRRDGGDRSGPFADDFVTITDVSANARGNAADRGPSTGTFISRCGTNENGHRNADDPILAPGDRGGAQEVNDYVGNLSTDRASTNDSLAAADTTCAGGDRSAYFWPVLRTLDVNAPDTGSRSGSRDRNAGTVLRPASVRLELRGNATSRVRAMPKFLRAVTGDPEADSRGSSAPRATWTCTGFEDRTTDRYPVCPGGSRVERILDFPSCWDGHNTDSDNHRSHLVFPGRDGSCRQDRVAVPQLHVVLTYDVPADSLFALDAAPDRRHDPRTDHAGFVNVMPNSLMRSAVDCINNGRTCDADGPVGADPTGSAGKPGTPGSSNGRPGAAAPRVPAPQQPTHAPPPAQKVPPAAPPAQKVPPAAPPAQKVPPANPPGAAAGQGNGLGNAQGNGPGNAQGNGPGNAQGNGPGNGQGNGPGNAQGNGPGNAQGNGLGGLLGGLLGALPLPFRHAGDAPPTADPSASAGATPGQVDAAGRPDAEPPLADAPQRAGAIGEPARTPPATGGTARAGTPTGGVIGDAATVRGRPAPAAAAEHAADRTAPAAENKRTMLYAIGMMVLVALVTWLGVLIMRRRRPAEVGGS